MFGAMHNLHWDQPFIQFGVGAFETLRCRDGKFPLAEAHRCRLQKALAHWRCEPSLLDAPWAEFIQKGKASRGEQRFKILVGLDERGGIIHHIYQFDYQALPAKRQLCLAPAWNVLPQPYKSSSYAGHYLARQEALRVGVDDVLYVDPAGRPLECSTSAIMEYREGIFWIPQGPVLESVSVGVLVENYPENFKRSPALEPGHWQDRHWVTCNALHGLRVVERIFTTSSSSQDFASAETCPLIDATLVDSWNQKLFSSPSL